jgi:hypothetical protein
VGETPDSWPIRPRTSCPSRVRAKAYARKKTLRSAPGTTAGTLARIELAQTSPEWRTVRSLAAELDVSLRQLAMAVEKAEHTLISPVCSSFAH